MKKLHLLLLSITLCVFSACHNDIWDAIDGLDSRVTKLEELCKEMNTNITSLQTIVDVLQSNDFITSIVEIKKDGKVVGYTITFGKHDPITIYHGQDGKDGADGKDGQDGTNGKDGQDGADGKDGQNGADGKDGSTPVIGVAQDTDGVYYWTLNGEWLLDDNGNKLPVTGKDGKDGQDGADGKDGQDGTDGKDGQNGADGKDGQDGSSSTPVIGVAQDTDGVYYWTLNGEWLLDDNGNKLPVSGKDGQNGTNGSNGQDGQNGKDGITPQLKIEEGYWYISYDNGATWTQLGKATGEDGKDGQNGSNGTNGKDGQDGDSMFQSVTQDDSYVYFTLADGTVIKIAKGSGNTQSNSEFLFEVTFDANGGVGIMAKDTFNYGQAKSLDYSAFGKDGYAFIGWNTTPDGTGAFYQNGASLTIDKNITLYAQWEAFNGVLPGKFSIAEGKQIQFASGNLQYQASTNKWRFAENQYDCIGSKNAKISETNTDWIDLFGYGTSGQSPYFPYLTEIYSYDRGYTESPSTYYYPHSSLTRENGLDWGVNNIETTTITGWRTLTGTSESVSDYATREWVYITYSRSKASQKKALASVAGVNGLLLLPDVWKQPSGVSFVPSAEHFYLNEYTEEQWIVLASQGAVFLPAAGYRRGVNVVDTGSKVIYWSSSPGDYSKRGAALIVYEGGQYNNNILESCCGFVYDVSIPLASDGCAVRLVIDVQ